MTFDNQFQWLNTGRNHPLPAWWRMPMFRTGFSQGNNTLEHSDQKCERKENAERVFYCNHILPKGGESIEVDKTVINTLSFFTKSILSFGGE